MTAARVGPSDRGPGPRTSFPGTGSGWLSQGCLAQELSGLYDLAGGRRVR